jgi:hypothetical protein
MLVSQLVTFELQHLTNLRTINLASQVLMKTHTVQEHLTSPCHTVYPLDDAHIICLSSFIFALLFALLLVAALHGRSGHTQTLAPTRRRRQTLNWFSQ